ncbi:MAG TPA: PAS domain S-box protein [Candidatus Cloacimonadota bacterium]|nr:PAS domain S-box protein [Candidatus Cloacimonadota bacterium]
MIKKTIFVILFFFLLINLYTLEITILQNQSVMLFILSLICFITLCLLFFICIRHKKQLWKEESAASQNLISVSKDILCILSQNWSILQMNPSFEKVLAYNRKEMINHNFAELLDPDEKENFIRVKKDLKTQEKLEFNTKLLSKSGEERWVSWYAFFDQDSMKIYAAGRDITNENLFLLQLQQSEERARKQFKSIPIPTYTWKRQGDDYLLVDYNDMVFKMTDGEVQDHIGIKASELLKNNYQVLRDMDYCYITRKPIHKEIEFYIEDDNKKLHFVTSYAFVPPDSVMIHMEDITDKKNIEMELRNNEEKYRALFNTSTDAILLIDLQGKIKDCNIATSTLFNFSSEELTGKEISDLFVTEHLASFDKDIVNGVEELVFQLFGMEVIDGFVEVNCIKKNQMVFPAETQAQFFTFKNDRIVLLYVRDITERKVMETQIKESSARLRTAFESLPFDFWFTNKDLVFLMQSNHSTELWGNLIGHEIKSSPIPDEVKQQWSKDCSIALNGEKLMKEVSFSKPNNKIFYQMIVPVLSDNDIKGLLGINIDITENRMREEELRKYSIDLERVNQELKSFAYIVSHDLKAPLRAITTMVDWLITDYDEKLDDEGKNILSLLNNRTKRMHDLIDGILKYSRVGRQNVIQEEIEIGELINHVCQMLIIPDHIKLQIEDQMPIIWAGRVHMEQIFQNLISNAIKFMDKESGLIKIACKTSENSHLFSVEDNGPGIEERHFNKIFEIFQTLKPRDEFESTGVGLSIVKKIIENLGGEIWLESNVGQGTIFYFSIPINEKPDNS